MYVIMTNDSPHAAFTNKATAKAYAKAGNGHDEIKNPGRVVFYNVHHLELDWLPPFYGESLAEATARAVKGEETKK